MIDTAIRILTSQDYQEFRQERQTEYNRVGLPLCPKNVLLPFQFTVPTDSTYTPVITLYDESDILIETVGTSISDFYRRVDIDNAIDIIQYMGNIVLTSNISTGIYYLNIVYGSNTLYSDLIRICDFEYDITNYTLINATDKTLINATDKTLI